MMLQLFHDILYDKETFVVCLFIALALIALCVAAAASFLELLK